MYNKENTRIELNYRVYKGLTNTGNCIVCNDTFKSRSVMSLYCSQRCKNDKYIERRQKIALNKRKSANKCKQCDTAITQNEATKLIKYCSNKCKQKAYRKTSSKCL